ncbi:hypothetical protein EVJ50_01160 [Synechococcus sp. RSCCF101]|uniref:hypothetical protein n=1 Tax=Synechococcus sp. RSCCF101 TaxID=2511069 RepID=UPI00124440FA|nr:hypothetical protein [Synechococcus sp. RSCCF101]QEY31066.1 hypothetical protein EVJ50_01160 [Synechococcus sp. RSCCF101]
MTRAGRGQGVRAALVLVLLAGAGACSWSGWHGTAEEAARSCRLWVEEGGTFLSHRYVTAGQFLSGDHEDQPKEHPRRSCITREETREVQGYEVELEEGEQPYPQREHPSSRLARRWRW